MQVKWRENITFRLLALFLALVLWVYVTHQKNPVLERATRVTLEYSGLPAQMLIMEMPDAVTVHYKTAKGRLALLRADDFKATLNLSGLGAGRHSIPVQVHSPPGIEITKVAPEKATVVLDREIEKEIPVEVKVRGEPPPGSKWLEPVVEPQTVRATGPEQHLRNLGKLTAAVDITGATEEVTKIINLNPGMESIQLNPSSVKVTVPVQPLPSKQVEVTPDITGRPAEGYALEDVRTNPGTVKIYGPAEALAGLEEVKTKRIDISGATAGITRNVKVLLPPGPFDLVVPEEVEVIIGIEPTSPQQEGDSGTPPPEDEA